MLGCFEKSTTTDPWQTYAKFESVRPFMTLRGSLSSRRPTSAPRPPHSRIRSLSPLRLHSLFLSGTAARANTGADTSFLAQPRELGLRQQCVQTTFKIAEALINESSSTQRLEVTTPPPSPPHHASETGRDYFAIRGRSKTHKTRAQESLDLLRTHAAKRLSCI